MDPAELGRLLELVPWHEFLRVTDGALYPYVHYSLEQHQMLKFLPEEVREVLRSARQANAILYLRRRELIACALGALNKKQIPVIALKGAALAHLVYPQPDVRYMQDIDLLVPMEFMSCAAEELIRAGMRYRVSADEVSPWFLEDEFQMIGGSQTNPIMMEVHGRIKGPFRSDHELRSLWQRSYPMASDHLPARTLEPHDLLLYLCVHLSLHHCFERSLLWLLDIRLCLERWKDSFDWNRLMRESRRSSASRAIYTVLLLAKELLQAAVPDEFFQAFPSDYASPEVKALALEQMWSTNIKRVPFVGLMNVISAGSWKEGCRYVGRRVRGWASSEPTPGAAARPGLWTKMRRMNSDLRVHLATYRIRFQEGSLSPVNLWLFLRQCKRRQRLLGLIG